MTYYGVKYEEGKNIKTEWIEREGTDRTFISEIDKKFITFGDVNDDEKEDALIITSSYSWAGKDPNTRPNQLNKEITYMAHMVLNVNGQPFVIDSFFPHPEGVARDYSVVVDSTKIEKQINIIGVLVPELELGYNLYYTLENNKMRLPRTEITKRPNEDY